MGFVFVFELACGFDLVGLLCLNCFGLLVIDSVLGVGFDVGLLCLWL